MNYLVIEYDDGENGAWEFDTLEEAKEFMAKKYAELDPENYWTKYYIEKQGE